MKSPEASTQIIKALLGSQYPAPRWGTLAENMVRNESALCILLTGKETESENTCYTDAIPGAWCVVAGSRTIYMRSPAEGPEGTDVITDPSHPGARAEHAAGKGKWRRTEVRAGDRIYMPQKWWHQVYAPHERVSDAKPVLGGTGTNRNQIVLQIDSFL